MNQTKALAKTRDTMVMTLIKIFMAGPEVSLKGSPTVSPTTAAFYIPVIKRIVRSLPGELDSTDLGQKPGKICAVMADIAAR